MPNISNLPGPRAESWIDRDEKFLCTTTRSDYYPFVMDHGHGAEIWDVDGNRFIDFAAGIAVVSTGHSHPKVVRAIKEQAERFLHISGTDFYYPEQVKVAEKLTEIAPMSGDKGVFLCNSGAEAVEAALKLARYYQGQRSQFIAFYGAFHGRTMGALAFTASKSVQRDGFSPFMPGVTHVPFSNPYRCKHGREESVCKDDCICVDYIEETIFRNKVPAGDVAAVIVEPIQGEGGYVFPADDFLPKLRRLCDRHNILLIVDEIQSGMGRTGRWFAIEHWGVEPDIICVAKGIASGMPLGAMIARRDLMSWRPGAHASTFGGNPVSCVAALATIELIENSFMQNAAKMGDYIINALTEMEPRHPSMGRIQGKGLMIGVELVKDRLTKEPAEKLCRDVVERAFRKGLLLLSCGTSTVRFIPPLSIERNLVDEGLRIFEEALTEAEKTTFGW
jgi:4-aminobutyrate aminotransferase